MGDRGEGSVPDYASMSADAGGKEAETDPANEDREPDKTKEESEQEVDETVEETFPASDPPAW